METTVEIALNDPTPIAFRNVYEDGDKWIKAVGCEACPENQRAACCGNCPRLIGNECEWHIGDRKANSHKPFCCIVKPTPLPDAMQKPCAIVYKCVIGSYKGKYRRVQDRRGVLRVG